MTKKKTEKQKTIAIKSQTKVYENIRSSLIAARTKTFNAINSAMVSVYWEIGHEIAQDIGERAEYGRQLLQFLSERLTAEFGKGFTVRNLRAMRQFHAMFPIRHAVRAELTWSHYRLLMRVEESSHRDFYLKESADSGWTSRQLERQINSFYYERLLATQKNKRDSVKNEIQTLEPKKTADYILKDPYILEFLDLCENKTYHENELEQALIDNLQKFLLELGKGFSFVERQKRISTEGGERYYIDLVFYNYILKCFVVIDLKAGKLAYQDIGQIDFYVRLFDEKIKSSDDNPTIGIVLCADKDESVVKYSVLADKENLFASKYRLYLPTEEQFQAQIQNERQAIERKLKESDFKKQKR